MEREVSYDSQFFESSLRVIMGNIVAAWNEARQLFIILKRNHTHRDNVTI